MILRSVTGLVLGIAAGCIGVGAAWYAAGAGHGTYGPAALLFPYTMLSTRFIPGLSALFVVVGLIQYPLYGLFVACASNSDKRTKIIGVIFVVHALTAVAAYYGRGEGFYP